MGTAITAAVRHVGAGRWQHVLGRLGIDQRHLRNRQGPCSDCGRKDRFSFENKGGRGAFVCGRAASRPISVPGFALVQQVFGCSFTTAPSLVASVMGIAPSASSIRPASIPPQC